MKCICQVNVCKTLANRDFRVLNIIDYIGNHKYVAIFFMGGDAMNQKEQPNRLAFEKSPYLLQHANNPVNWFPWGDEAFAKAKAEDKPVFLSIGYS